MYKGASERTNRRSIQPAVARRFAPIRPGCGEGVISDTTIARHTKTEIHLLLCVRPKPASYSSGSARLNEEGRESHDRRPACVKYVFSIFISQAVVVCSPYSRQLLGLMVPVLKSRSAESRTVVAGVGSVYFQEIISSSEKKPISLARRCDDVFVLPRHAR